MTGAKLQREGDANDASGWHGHFLADERRSASDETPLPADWTCPGSADLPGEGEKPVEPGIWWCPPLCFRVYPLRKTPPPTAIRRVPFLNLPPHRPRRRGDASPTPSRGRRVTLVPSKRRRAALRATRAASVTETLKEQKNLKNTAVHRGRACGRGSGLHPHDATGGGSDVRERRRRRRRRRRGSPSDVEDTPRSAPRAPRRRSASPRSS